MNEITRNKRCNSTLDLRDFLNEIEAEFGINALKKAYVVGIYSDDIPGGDADATFVIDPSNEDHAPYLEVVGGSEMV